MKNKVLLSLLILAGLFAITGCEPREEYNHSNSNDKNESGSRTNSNDVLSILNENQKNNFIKSLEECNIDYEKIENLIKKDDWSNGERYSFSYKNDTLWLYLNDDDTVNSINLNLGGLHIYDEKYESLDYNNYYISMDIAIKMESSAENYVDTYLKDADSADYKWTSYQRTNEYYAISGTVTSNNSFGQPVSNTVYVEFKNQSGSLSVVYVSLNGATTYGSKVVPEVKRIERKVVDNSTDDKIVLNDGIEGNYGKYDIFDGKKYLRFHVPTGKYKVTALVKNSMFYVESIELHKEDGYDVPITYDTVNLSKKGDTQTIEVVNGQCISLVMGTKVELVKID